MFIPLWTDYSQVTAEEWQIFLNLANKREVFGGKIKENGGEEAIQHLGTAI